jgi:hypothetical protein
MRKCQFHAPLPSAIGLVAMGPEELSLASRVFFEITLFVLMGGQNF